ncbi:MAG: hypothetical protein NTV49_01720 [Kiritimatiellaeota bacterium]|nr:hypothetical protein [Kiritimatiellota bacterium]
MNLGKRWAALCLLLGALSASAQQIGEGLPPARTPPAVTNAAVRAPGAAGIEVNADQLEFLQDTRTAVGRGHVVITRGADRMTADYAELRTDTEEAHARGNLTFDRAGQIWRGEELTYNFKTGQGDFGAFSSYTEPFFIRADESRRVSPNEFLMKNVTVTTCDGDEPQFYLQAKQAKIVNGITLKAYGVVPHLGGLPIFYMPYWTRSLEPEAMSFDLLPGYSSRMGAFVLGAASYKVATDVRGTTHLDYRAKRGVGFGQDFRWKDRAPEQSYRGEARVYYLHDRQPFYDADEEAYRQGTTDQQRYRLRLQDARSLSDRDGLYVEGNFLSDPYVVEDFFDNEFRNSLQPENRVSLMHRGDNYSAGLLLNGRLNDFYENIDRLPEASLDVYRMRLGETPFYYESHNTASFLRHVYPKNTDTNAPATPDASYDAFRLDTGHTVYYPTRHFDFLNVTPRAGYRGTFYSKTYTTVISTNLVSVTNITTTATSTNSTITTTNQVENTLREMGASLRSLPELGVATSFKAFKVLNPGPTGIGHDVGLRHVAEPYADYTFRPKPNLEPADLPQFDEVDQLGMENDVRLGMRNKLQTQRRNAVHNLVDADVYTFYRVEKPPGTSNDFDNIYFLTRLRLVDWLMLDFDGVFDPYQGQFTSFNTQLAFLTEDQSRLAIEHRYTRDSLNLLSGELTLFPNREWSFRLYARYDLEGRQLQDSTTRT